MASLERGFGEKEEKKVKFWGFEHRKVMQLGEEKDSILYHPQLNW